MKLIEHEVQGSPVQQRATDGYINATAMCRIAGKRWGHYNENGQTQAFLNALEADVGIPTSELVKSVKGGDPRIQGTWVHPQVAVHLAQWLSPEFAVKVSKWVYDCDPPPLKWSSAMFRKTEETHGQQATEAGRDCHEVKAG
nr:KilA-N domain-containing protein [Shimia aestuarii]